MKVYSNRVKIKKQLKTRLLGSIYLSNIIMKALFKEIQREGVGMK